MKIEKEFKKLGCIYEHKQIIIDGEIADDFISIINRKANGVVLAGFNFRFNLKRKKVEVYGELGKKELKLFFQQCKELGWLESEQQ